MQKEEEKKKNLPETTVIIEVQLNTLGLM